jgi:hypothetical protein
MPWRLGLELCCQTRRVYMRKEIHQNYIKIQYSFTSSIKALLPYSCLVNCNVKTYMNNGYVVYSLLMLYYNLLHELLR